MGIFKDAGDTILKYGEILAHKTEGYTKIAKLTFDIKKLEGKEEEIKTKIGGFVIDKMEKSEITIDLKDPELKKNFNELKKIHNDIKKLKKDIEEHKSMKPEQSEKTEKPEKKETAKKTEKAEKPDEKK